MSTLVQASTQEGDRTRSPQGEGSTALDHDEIRFFFAERAATADSPGHDVRPGLQFLSELGVLGRSAGSEGGPDLLSAVQLVETIAGECLSSAFSLWAHMMVLEYLARGRSTDLLAEARDRLLSGQALGSTAMSTALRDIAGIEGLPIRADVTAQGLRLNGRIPWASNLFPGAVVVAPVALNTTEQRAVVALPIDAPGIQVSPPPTLLALNGTGSSTVKLEEVEVHDDAVISTDLAGFVDSFRPTFLLLQSALCTGVARRSLSEASERARGPNSEFTEEVTELTGELDDLRSHSQRLSEDVRREPIRSIVRMRLAASQLAVNAARLEAAVTGGAGYTASSSTSRRLRETAFMPIQAPTEGHLRWELKQQS